MSSHTFLKGYASKYDKFYEEKDYTTETDFLHRIFQYYEVKKVLDIACGTGEHIRKLYFMGYDAIGQDISRSMIKIAKNKFEQSHNPPEFKVCSMQNIKYNKQFDAVICMFAAIDYLKKEELPIVFKKVCNSLVPGGIFIFDFWNKPCVLKNYKLISVGKDKISYTTLDKKRDISSVKIVYGKNKYEIHNMTYYEPKHIEDLLVKSGFEVVKLFPLMKPYEDITDKDWSVQVFARRWR